MVRFTSFFCSLAKFVLLYEKISVIGQCLNNYYDMNDDKQWKQTDIDPSNFPPTKEKISNTPSDPKIERIKHYLSMVLLESQQKSIDQIALTISKSWQQTKQLIQKQLNLEDISCHWDVFFNELEYSIAHYTFNDEVIRLNVKYAHYSLMINLILVDKMSPTDNLTLVSEGRFGKVYKAFREGATIAIKKICTKQPQFLDCFKNVIKEYTILKIASALQIGPKAIPIYGFDIVIYRDCLEFSMELCESIQQPNEQKLMQIKAKLFKLHSANIVHCDIKPDNISFSSLQQNYVFIDFGLSKAVKENLGEPSYSGFVGSLQFCSPEMAVIFIGDAKQFIDLYANDACALKKSIKAMQKGIQLKQNSNQLYYELQQNLLFNFYNLQKIIYKKAALYRSIFNRELHRIHELTRKTEENNEQIIQFIKMLPIDENIYTLYQQPVNQGNLISERSAYRHTQQSYLQAHSSSHFRDTFYLQIWLQVAKISSLPGLTTLALPKPKSSYPSINTLNLLRVIKINGLTDEFEDKILICKAYLTQISFHHASLTPVDIYCTTLINVWRHIFSPFDVFKVDYLAELIETVIMLQLVGEDQLLADIKTVVDTQIPLMHKIFIMMKFTYFLNYLSQKYVSTYSNQLTTKFYTILSQFASSCKQQNDLEVNSLIVRHLSEIALDQQSTAQCLSILDDIHTQGIIITHWEESILELIELHKCLKLVCHIIQTGQLSSAEIIDKIFRRSIKAFYKDICITPLHSEIYFLSTFSNPTVNQKLSFQFNEELLVFKEGRQFYTYFACQLMNLVKMMTVNRIEQRELKTPLSEKQKISPIRQAFRMLGIMDANYRLYFSFIDCLINLLHTSQDPLFLRESLQFYRTNIGRYITILKTINSAQIHLKKIVVLVQISTIYNIISLLGTSSAISKQQFQTLLSSFMHSCQKMIQTICFCCKSSILLQCKLFLTRILLLQSKAEDSMLLMCDLTAVYLKHHELRRKIYYVLLDLVLMWTEIEYIYNRYNVLFFICEIMKQLNMETICLFETSKQSILVNLYAHIALIYSPLQFSQFMGNLLKCLYLSSSYISEMLFYSSIVYAVKHLTSEAKLEFKLYHNQVITHLLSHKTSKHNLIPQYYLYFSALLQVYVKDSEDQALLKVIAENMDRVNSNCKKLILSQHYYQYVFYVQCSQRKATFLRIKHYRKTNSQYSAKFFMKKMIKKCSNPDLRKRFISMLGSKIIRCHKNIGNLKQNI